MFRFALAAAALLAASASAQGNWDRLTTTFGVNKKKTLISVASVHDSMPLSVFP